MVAESLLVKHQLLVLSRPRGRAPNLRPMDRIIAGLCAGLMRPARLARSAIVLKPSTIVVARSFDENTDYCSPLSAAESPVHRDLLAN